MSGPVEQPAVSQFLGRLAPAVAESLRSLSEERVVERLWSRDHTLWHDRPAGITDRLGWLTAPETFSLQLDELIDFATEIRDEAIRDVVLLGMGGSSLGAECLRHLFGCEPGYPALHVLDSTVPAQVAQVRSRIDPRATLFLVASKSGSTAEVLNLFEYFWDLATTALDTGAGSRFVAITDPESPLVRIAVSRGFRRVFPNPADIGGRFSVLSRFGLLPAALLGVDLGELMASARWTSQRCRSDRLGAVETEISVDPEVNPGAWLGAVLGAATQSGRDKLTFLTSPRLAKFGLWAEQLIAESTGKDGKGIIPIVDEPFAAADCYRQDRLFVVMRLDRDSNADLDAQAERLRSAGHPMIAFELGEPAHLGGEFVRWQVAVAVAAHLIGVHPFDQPDVEETKINTRRLLESFETDGQLPQSDPGDALFETLRRGEPPSYVALMAYASADPALDRAIAQVRRWILERHRLASTFGYAPRLLHSTGQLHKGGPDGGLFVQLLALDEPGIPIPDRPYSFGTLAHAQAVGDWQALTARGRRCLRVELGAEPANEALRLATDVAAESTDSASSEIPGDPE